MIGEPVGMEKPVISLSAGDLFKGALLRASVALGIVFLLSGCAARRDVVVLIADPDGKTGSIEVSNQGGSTVLAEANSATEVKSSATAPAAAAKMDESKIRAIFGQALGAAPRPPEHYRLYFKSDSTELTEDSLQTLEYVFSAIGRTKPSQVTVVGHTDRTGPRDANFRLGLERASQIKNLLISKGMDEGLIEIRSHGEDDPLVKTDDEVPEAKNRRVEIVIR
jgi:outer membrane protein OmpA-like peptidoglycan-associated protein